MKQVFIGVLNVMFLASRIQIGSYIREHTNWVTIITMDKLFLNNKKLGKILVTKNHHRRLINSNNKRKKDTEYENKNVDIKFSMHATFLKCQQTWTICLHS